MQFPKQDCRGGCRPVLLLVAIMAVVASGSVATVGHTLYAAALEQQRQRLVEIAESRAHLIGAMARFDMQHSTDAHPEGPAAATLSQIRQAHAEFEGFGETGEFTLARHAGDQIVFLLSHRHGGLSDPAPVPFHSERAEPMRRALRGEAGSVVALDYRGAMVMSAYAPVPELDLGVVAKIDLAEVRAPFARAALIAGGIGLVLVLSGAFLFVQIMRPMIRRLRQSELRFRALVEQSPAITYTAPVDRPRTTLNMSPQIEQSLGFSVDDWTTDPDMLAKLLHPEDRERVEAELTRAYVSGDRFSSEYRMLSRDGRVVWFEDKCTVLGDDEPFFILGVILDITARKVAEAALKESEERFRAVVESAMDGLVVIDDAGRIVSWNKAAEVIFGYSRQEAVGESVEMLIPDQYRGLYQRVLEELEADGKATMIGTTHEVVGLRKGGSEFPLEISLGAFELGGRQYLSGLLRDVTRRRRAEEDMQRLAAAVDHVGEGIVITDTEGTVQYINPAFEKISGYSAAEIIGQNPRILRSGEHDDAFYREFWETISSGEVWNGHFVNRRKDGSLYQEDATVSPICDDKGQIVSYVAVKRDVSQDIAMEEQLRHSQKMEAVGQLAGGVAHDFNNLLTGIGGYTQLVLPKLGSDGKVGADLRRVMDLVDKASDLTRRLMLFSRREPLELKVVNLNELIVDATEMLQRLVGEHIEIQLLTGPGLANVRSDPAQIQQVIINLMLNARDAMPDGGRLVIQTSNVTLDVGSACGQFDLAPGAYAMLAVSDTGHGMDETTKQRVFEPFFTTKEVGKGTGLGLATVYGIVHQHGGAISVDSAPGEGTTFTVYLPRVEEETTAPTPTDHGHALARGEETILVVEDEEVVREVVARQLEGCGYTVLTAARPERAEELYARHGDDISLLLTDVIMPGYDGKTLYQHLAVKDPALKVLFMSGCPDRAVEFDELLEGGSAFMRKPFTAEELTREVREVLDR